MSCITATDKSTLDLDMFNGCGKAMSDLAIVNENMALQQVNFSKMLSKLENRPIEHFNQLIMLNGLNHYVK